LAEFRILFKAALLTIHLLLNPRSRTRQDARCCSAEAIGTITVRRRARFNRVFDHQLDGWVHWDGRAIATRDKKEG
jgi:hypothetical protein